MGILVLFGTSLLIFTIARVVPGDVATIALGARATEAAKEALRMEMNLYDPFPVQYVKWLTSAVTGNFGNSFVTKRPVAMDVASSNIGIDYHGWCIYGNRNIYSWTSGW